jgi:hypothetical protein
VSWRHGFDLKKRIEEIMTKDSSHGRVEESTPDRGRIVAFVAPVAVGALNPRRKRATLLRRQHYRHSKRRRFESIPHLARRDADSTFQPRGGSPEPTLKTMLKQAFAKQGAGGPNTSVPLGDSQVIGGPDWLDTDKFDIVAVTPAATQPTQPEQMRQMISSACWRNDSSSRRTGRRESSGLPAVEGTGRWRARIGIDRSVRQ